MGNLLKRVVSCAMICLIGVASTGITTVEMPITTITASADETYKTWKQGDSRWGKMRLGGSSYTMSNSGCAATALSMLMVHSGSITDSSFTPGTLCTFFNNNGGFSNKGDISWGVSSKLASSFTFEGYASLSSSSVSGKVSEIENYLDEGYFLIVGVKSGGHWVAIDRVENGVVYMFDPANGKNVSLFNAYDNSGIYKVRKFKGANSVSTSVTTTVEEKEDVAEEVKDTQQSTSNTKPSTSTPTSSYTTGLYKITSELRFRTDAYLDADIIDIIPASTSINVSEINGEWGYVCYNGNMGWINLAYTSKLQNSYKYETGTYTTAEPLNFRESNTTSSNSYGLIPVNTKIEILEVKDNWGKVSYEGKSAWVCLDYVSVGDTTFSSSVNIAVSNSDKNIGNYTTTDNLYIRNGADTSFPTIDLINNGTDIMIIAVNGNWGKTIYNGSVGWVCLDYATYKNSFSFLPCDINNDGSVNITDLLYVSNKLKNGSKFTSNEVKLIDLNQDGKVDSTDYILFKGILLL